MTCDRMRPPSVFMPGASIPIASPRLGRRFGSCSQHLLQRARNSPRTRTSASSPRVGGSNDGSSPDAIATITCAKCLPSYGCLLVKSSYFPQSVKYPTVNSRGTKSYVDRHTECPHFCLMRMVCATSDLRSPELNCPFRRCRALRQGLVFE